MIHVRLTHFTKIFNTIYSLLVQLLVPPQAVNEEDHPYKRDHTPKVKAEKKKTYKGSMMSVFSTFISTSLIEQLIN